MPGARWILRRRVNRVLEEVEARLKIRIPPFKLTKREVLIARLVDDPQVQEAAQAEEGEAGATRASVRRRIDTYAREIVPQFNAYLYFRLGYRIARWLVRLLYRVRLGYSDEAGLAAVDPNSTVVFLINHRSNMDYVLVSYLAAEKAALSYAVGEWARIWPLQTLIRSMGAYFVRRNSKDPLYRKVLERYVAMATDAGVTQAVFPEGGLSREGTLRKPRLGILDYIVRAFDPDGRDIAFVPVGNQLRPGLRGPQLPPRARRRDRAEAEGRRARPRTPCGSCSGISGPDGTQPVASLRLRVRQLRIAGLARGLRRSLTASTSARCRRRSGSPGSGSSATISWRRSRPSIPVVPVPLVATAFVRDPDRPRTELELKAEVLALINDLARRGAHVYLPRKDQDYAITVGLRMLTLRHLVDERDGLFTARPDELPLLTYYANSIAHLFSGESQIPSERERR